MTGSLMHEMSFTWQTQRT